MANNTDILGEEATVRQIVSDDFSATDGVFEDDSVTNLRQNALSHRNTLTDVSLPNIVDLPAYCFYNCSYLKKVSFPKLISSGSNSFMGTGYRATDDVIYVFPSLETVGTDFLRESAKNGIFDFGSNLTSLPTRFIYNFNFTGSLILRSPTVVTASNSNSIDGIKNGATVYVPQSLISSYQTATNWSAKYAAGVTFSSIEGTYYETHYADGTEVST